MKRKIKEKERKKKKTEIMYRIGSESGRGKKILYRRKESNRIKVRKG